MYSPSDFTEKLTTLNNNDFYSNHQALLYLHGKSLDDRYKEVDLLYHAYNKILESFYKPKTFYIPLVYNDFVKNKFSLTIYLDSKLRDDITYDRYCDGKISEAEYINSLEFLYIMEIRWKFNNEQYCFNYQLSDLDMDKMLHNLKYYLEFIEYVSNGMLDNYIDQNGIVPPKY